MIRRRKEKSGELLQTTIKWPNSKIHHTYPRPCQLSTVNKHEHSLSLISQAEHVDTGHLFSQVRSPSSPFHSFLQVNNINQNNKQQSSFPKKLQHCTVNCQLLTTDSDIIKFLNPKSLLNSSLNCVNPQRNSGLIRLILVLTHNIN